MSGSLIHNLIQKETQRQRNLGRGYEASARAATAYVELIHLREKDAERDRVTLGRTLRKRTA